MKRKKSKKEDFNIHHPELQKGELFLTNVHPFVLFPTTDHNPPQTSFEELGWKTKRLGSIAYSSSGKEIRTLRPVFVKEMEFNRKRGTMKKIKAATR